MIRATVLTLLLGASSALYAEDALRFDLPPQDLASSLNQVGVQADRQIVFAPELVKGVEAPALSGSFTLEEALTRLLGNSGLRVEYLDAKTVAIRPKKPATSEAATEKDELRMAQTDADPAGAPMEQAQQDSGKKQQETVELEEVVVTGTHIRSSREVTPPLLRMTRDDLSRTGYASLDRVFADLPQNFSDISPGGAASVDGTSALSLSNSVYATGANLRGLGAQSTLTLINGTRRAGSLQGQVVDLSTIPLSLVDRIDVVTGGRSAIYGADAVAGVVNIVTRREFNGAETQLYYGTPSGHGGGERLQASQVFGHSTDRSGFVAAYDYTRDQDLDLVKTGLVVSPLFGAEQLRKDIQPDRKSHSLYVSGRYALNDRVSLSGDAEYTHQNASALDLSLQPAGMSDSFIRNENTSTQLDVSAGVTLLISSAWRVDVKGTTGHVKENNPSEVFFDFGSFTFSSESRLRADAKLSAINAIAEGPLPALASIQPRMAVGIEERKESLEFRDVPSATVFNDSDRRVHSLFMELSLPLISGPRTLDASLAARYDDYSDFGHTVNPQIGLSWAPVKGLSLWGAWSKAFRAPALRELGTSTAGVILNEADPQTGGLTPVLLQTGSRDELGPEKARTWSAGIDFEPEFPVKTRISASYFEVKYRDRVDVPAIQGDIFLVLQNADRFAGLLNRAPTAGELEAVRVADSDGVIDNETGEPYDPQTQSVLDAFPNIALFDNRINNIAVERIRGVDLSFDTRFETPLGQMDLGLNSTYAFDHDRSVTSTSPAFSQLNQVGKPVDWRVRANVGWTRASYGLYTYINYVDDYANPFVSPVGRIASWTTVDLALRFDGSSSGLEAWKGLSATVSIDNVFDRNPPRFIGGSSPLRYDGTNASAVGRFLALRLSKAW